MPSFPRAQSALNLRLLLAGFGLVFCLVAAWLAWMDRRGLPGAWVFVAVLLVLALIAALDIAVVLRRRRERAAAERRTSGHTEHHGLFD